MLPCAWAIVKFPQSKLQEVDSYGLDIPWAKSWLSKFYVTFKFNQSIFQDKWNNSIQRWDEKLTAMATSSSSSSSKLRRGYSHDIPKRKKEQKSLRLVSNHKDKIFKPVKKKKTHPLGRAINWCIKRIIMYLCIQN